MRARNIVSLFRAKHHVAISRETSCRVTEPRPPEIKRGQFDPPFPPGRFDAIVCGDKEFALLMFAWMRLGRHDLAMDACRRGRSLFPLDPELRFREAVMHQDQGRLDEARRAYLDVLNHRGEERHFSSVDRALTGYKTRPVEEDACR
jgi:hypothetical protein